MIEVISVERGNGCTFRQAFSGPIRKHVHWVTHHTETGAEIIILWPVKHGFALPKGTAKVKSKGRRKRA